MHKDNSLWDFGIDWLAPYISTQHSMGILFVRCADVSARDKGKKWNQHVIAIIPGPRQPDVLAPYLTALIDELKVLADEGITVSPSACGQVE